jgi:hypothetical protein
VGLAASLSVLAAPASLPAVAGASHAPARPPVIGHLAYLTNGGAIDMVDVRKNRALTGKQRIGPLQHSTTAHPVTISNFVASGDGNWVAWQEARTTTKSRFSTTLVLRNQTSGQVHSVVTHQAPVGFAGDRLLTNDRHVNRLVLTPAPHFVRVAGNFPITTYAHGVVDAHFNSNDTAARLRLTSIGGKHTVLHRYTDVGPPDFREISQGWVSSDGKHLVVERGDHQDFGGLGPSSVVDEFNLHGHHARTPLGHVGALHAEWRLGDVAFRGPKDHVWAVWHRVAQHGVRTALAHIVAGKWVISDHHDIDVAANLAGYLVVQPGKYVLQNPNDDFFARRATSGAAVVLRQAARFSSIKGTQYFWVSG